MGSLVWTAPQEQHSSRRRKSSHSRKDQSCEMTDTDVAPAGGYQFPMVRYTDMDDDMKKEVMEICNTACDNHAANNELCAKNIKEVLDKKLDQAGTSLLGKDLDLRSATRRRKCFICSLQDARQSVSGSAHENCDPCLINY